MFVKVVAGAFVASALGVCCALAQSAADIGGPRELPPAGFTGQQFVDSRGCVFLRAGLGGTVNWVPRVDRDRKAMCGYPPTFGAGSRPAAVAAAEPVAKPVVKPAPVAKPAPVRVAGEPAPETYTPAPVRGVTVPVVAKPVMVAPAKPAPVVVPQRPVMAVEMPGTGNRIACTTAAPVPKRLALTNGGTVVVCTRGDGTLEGLRAPAYPAGARVGASIAAPLGQPSGIGDGMPGARLVDQGVSIPPGYKLAWEDDRLNPLRGVGTAEGQAAQDQVWTRRPPSKLVNEARPARVIVLSSQGQAEAPRLSVSTKSEPQAEGPVWVQVGSFGLPANADAAAARLSSMGLPVARSKAAIGGKAVQVVLAGPFGSAGDAQAALGAARGAGFGDAFMR